MLNLQEVRVTLEGGGRGQKKRGRGREKRGKKPVSTIPPISLYGSPIMREKKGKREREGGKRKKEFLEIDMPPIPSQLCIKIPLLLKEGEERGERTVHNIETSNGER